MLPSSASIVQHINSLHKYAMFIYISTAILFTAITGYIGDPTFLRQMVEVAKELKSLNPNLKYGINKVQ